jgi:hypothetical protein
LLFLGKKTQPPPLQHTMALHSKGIFKGDEDFYLTESPKIINNEIPGIFHDLLALIPVFVFL